jgi:hypothetical protein
MKTFDISGTFLYNRVIKYECLFTFWRKLTIFVGFGEDTLLFLKVFENAFGKKRRTLCQNKKFTSSVQKEVRLALF